MSERPKRWRSWGPPPPAPSAPATGGEWQSQSGRDVRPIREVLGAGVLSAVGTDPSTQHSGPSTPSPDHVDEHGQQWRGGYHGPR